MANSEILSALQAVRAAESAVNDALDRGDLSDDERDLLEERRTFLADLDDMLLHIELRSEIAKLQKTADRLDRLDAETQAKLKRLAKVAKAINTTAKVVDALVKAFGILVKAGLL